MWPNNETTTNANFNANSVYVVSNNVVLYTYKQHSAASKNQDRGWLILEFSFKMANLAGQSG